MPFLYQILSQGSGDLQRLRDIKPPLEVPQSLLPLLLVGGFLFIAIIIISRWLYIRKRRQPASPVRVAEVKTRTPHEIAYEQLKAIEATERLAKDNMNAYHTQIAHVIREYIEARYHIPALELPTTHLLVQLERQQIGGLYLEKVQHFLANCDKVKFAKYHPGNSEAIERMAEAKWFVDVTKMPD